MSEQNSTLDSVDTAGENSKTSQDSGGSFRRNLIQDCGKYAISQAAVIVNGLVLIPTITHLFPPAVYGDYVLCASFVNLGMLVLAGWLAQGTLRFYPAFEREGRQRFFLDATATVALMAVGLAAIVGAPVILVVQHLVRPELGRLLWFILPITLAYSLFFVSGTYLRSARLLSLYARTQVGGALFQPALGLLSLLLWRDIRAYFITWLFSLCVLNAWIWINIRPRPVWLEKLRAFSTGHLFAYGFPLVVSQLLTQVLLFADRYILAVIRTPREVGLYSLGFTIGQMPMNLLFAVEMSAVYPLLVHSWERGSPEAAVRNIRMSIRYYLLIAVPCLVGLSMLSRSIVAAFASRDYAPAASLVTWIAAGFFLSALAQFALMNTQLMKKPALQTWVMAFAAGVNVALNLLLVPRYGYSGSAVAVFLSMVVLAMASWVIAARLLPLSFPFSSLGRSAAATAVMALVLWALLSIGHSRGKAWSFWVIAPGGLAYFGSLYLFGELEPGERRAIRSLLRRNITVSTPGSDGGDSAVVAPHDRDQGAPQREEASV